MGLTSATPVEVAKRIIKRSRYDDLTTNEKRLTIYFAPSRRTRNQEVHEHVLQIDCHVPATTDYVAWRVVQQVVKLLHRQTVNNQCMYAEPPLGELPTMSGFFCAAARLAYSNTI
jgi:hypothetical protein